MKLPLPKDKEVMKWLKKNKLPTRLASIVVDVPRILSSEDEDDIGEFYIDLEPYGSDWTLESKNEKDLIAWLKLTDKLLL